MTEGAWGQAVVPALVLSFLCRMGPYCAADESLRLYGLSPRAGVRQVRGPPLAVLEGAAGGGGRGAGRGHKEVRVKVALSEYELQTGVWKHRGAIEKKPCRQLGDGASGRRRCRRTESMYMTACQQPCQALADHHLARASSTCPRPMVVNCTLHMPCYLYLPYVTNLSH